jgi:TrmH family RNA methyltransferase
MGAHFHVPIIKLSWPEIQAACHQGPAPLTIYLASADASMNYWQAELNEPVAILIGNEAKGPGNYAFSLADKQLAIPMPGNTESLNVAIAASILLYEVVRQRSS